MNEVHEVWVDAQLLSSLAAWIEETFDVQAPSVKRLGLRDASDDQIFAAAREADAVVLTKDADFARLLALHGAPPRVVWLTFGNTTNAYVREVLKRTLPVALSLLAGGEEMVEVAGA